MSQTQDQAVYHAVMNHEEQYSIWPADRPLPSGWRVVGNAGTKAEVLAFIEQAWTDLRPLSVRQDMDRGDGGGRGGREPPVSGA